MRRKRTRFKKIACFILAILSVFSTHLLAKYVSSTSGSSSVSVARWTVNWSATSSDVLNLVSGNNTGSYAFNVSSLSEVAARYSITISGAPSGMEIKLDNGTFQTVGLNGEVTFDNAGSFIANDTNSVHSHTLTFNSPLSSSIPSANSINVVVRFVQND